ncbi:hypothetical protein F5Y15DRAFT_323009 [Xylariaceae sp. FL0016]|nr:hypothetical protein F5Y15DRAFT_323009 [Xylariaceae sp. FL0016]
MQKRRSHKKSRRGCLNCKKWHTKCDERGPPCGNCTLRNAKCEYAWATRDMTVSVRHPVSRQASTSSSDDSCVTLNKTIGLAPKGSRRLLELELMHLWSTYTYQSLCSVPEDVYYMQVVLPREALEYDFLLNGILVSSALHKAFMSPEPEARGYFKVALELYDQASTAFRAQLGTITKANHHELYIYSSMTTFINIAFAQYSFMDGDETNLLSNVAVAFDLLNGCVSIALADWDQLLDSPVPIRTYLGLGRASLDLLDPDTRTALARLKGYNRNYYAALAPDSQEKGTEVATSTSANRFAPLIDFLEVCFAEDVRGALKGYCYTFPAAGGPAFAAAVKSGDPMALLILLHWTILIQRGSEEYWWARNLGQRLAKGIGVVMQQTQPAFVDEWWDSVSWVQQQLLSLEAYS